MNHTNLIYSSGSAAAGGICGSGAILCPYFSSLNMGFILSMILSMAESVSNEEEPFPVLM
jgi:hypothetical protein